jgi:hypothetical protein
MYLFCASKHCGAQQAAKSLPNHSIAMPFKSDPSIDMPFKQPALDPSLPGTSFDMPFKQPALDPSLPGTSIYMPF